MKYSWKFQSLWRGTREGTLFNQFSQAKRASDSPLPPVPFLEVHVSVQRYSCGEIEH